MRQTKLEPGKQRRVVQSPLGRVLQGKKVLNALFIGLCNRERTYELRFVCLSILEELILNKPLRTSWTCKARNKAVSLQSWRSSSGRNDSLQPKTRPSIELTSWYHLDTGRLWVMANQFLCTSKSVEWLKHTNNSRITCYSGGKLAPNPIQKTDNLIH